MDFAAWARETGYVIRFIEYMPLDADHAWERAKVVPSRQIVDAIDRVFPWRPRDPTTSRPPRTGSPTARQAGSA